MPAAEETQGVSPRLLSRLTIAESGNRVIEKRQSGRFSITKLQITRLQILKLDREEGNTIL
jgi:hypothetical protein